MQNHQFRTLTGQIMQFAITQYHRQTISKVQLELIKKLCLQDNPHLSKSFKEHPNDEQYLLQVVQQLSERDISEERKSDTDDKKVKQNYKQELSTFVDLLSDMYQFIYCFTAQMQIDDITTLRAFHFVQKMFELGHLSCLKVDQIAKEITPISAKVENVNYKLDFQEVVHQLQNKRQNIIEAASEAIQNSFAKIGNPQFLQQLVFRYSNVQAIVVIDHGLKDPEPFVGFMRDLVELLLKQPQQLSSDQKTTVLECARVFLAQLCNKETEFYGNSRMLTTSTELKRKLKSSHFKFQSKLMVASERLHFYKQHLAQNYFDFDSQGKLRFCNINESVEATVQEGFGYQTHYHKVFVDDTLIMHLELTRSQVKLPEENASGALIYAKRFDGKFKGFSVVINKPNKSTSVPEGTQQAKRINPLNMVTKFKKAVSKVKFLNNTSRAFISKQLLQHNPTYRRTFMIEYLSDKELLGMQIPVHDVPYSIYTRMPKEPPGPIQQKVDSLNKSEKASKHPLNFSELGEFKRINYGINPEILERLDDPDLDILQYDENSKLAAVMHMLQAHDIPNSYKIEIEDLRTFLFILRHHYNKRRNPFHNFDHAVTVMHGCYYLSKQDPAIQIFSVFHIYGLILGGLCHDVDHRATTNLFLINSGDKLSHRYLDRSVLESHHAATSFKLMSNPNCDILKNLDIGMKTQLKKILINNILATDVREHFNQLSSFESKLNQYEDGYQQFSSEDQILHLQGLLTHASDFFGSTKPYKVSRVWSTKINAEFMRQYETEIKLGLPQTSYFKDVDKIQNQAKGELGFLRVIVKPLWELLNKFYAGQLTRLILNMDTAMEQWEQIFKTYQQEQQEKQDQNE